MATCLQLRADGLWCSRPCLLLAATRRWSQHTPRCLRLRCPTLPCQGLRFLKQIPRDTMQPLSPKAWTLKERSPEMQHLSRLCPVGLLFSDHLSKKSPLLLLLVFLRCPVWDVHPGCSAWAHLPSLSDREIPSRGVVSRPGCDL